MTGQNQSSTDMKKRRLTDNEWQSAREVWETDPRTGFAWLHAQLDLPVSRSAVSKRAAREGWEKQDAPEVVPQDNITPVVPPLSPTGTSEAGRPTEYKAEYVNVARAMFLLGSTIEQLADALSVCERTIYNWQRDHIEFFHAIKDAGRYADGRVAEALFNRALGYSHPDEEIKVINGEVVRVATIKHYPPDANSMRYWLNNRQPHTWKQKVEVQEEISISSFPPVEELDAMYERVLKQAAEKEKLLLGRAERLGLVLDGDLTTDTDD